MTKKLYYIKKGRRYIPVAEYDNDLLDSFPKGDHLVSVYPGGSSRRYKINAAYAPMIAAGRVAEDAICRAIYEASEARPKERPITARQRAAWEEIKAAFGDEFFNLNYGSTRDYAEAGVNAMAAEAAKLMDNPAVQKAWDNFQLVCALTKQQESAH